MVRSIVRKIDKCIFQFLFYFKLIRIESRPSDARVVQVIEERKEYHFDKVDWSVKKDLHLVNSFSTDQHILYVSQNIKVLGPYGLQYRKGIFYSDQLYSKVGHIQKSWPVASLASSWLLKLIVLDRAISLLHLFSKGYFHFIFDTVSKIKSVLGDSQILIIVDCNLLQWQKEWLLFVGVEESRMIRYNPAKEFILVKHLYNSDPPRGGLFRKETIEWLRSTLLEKMQIASDYQEPGYYYLQRKSTMFSASFLPSRIVNEEALIDFLRSRGFKVIYFDGKSLTEQIEIMRSAKVIVSAHGAGLSNMIFADKLALFEIHRSSHLNNVYFYLSYVLNFYYAYAIFPVDKNNNALIDYSQLDRKLTDFLAEVN